MTAREFLYGLGGGVVGSGLAAFFTTWWPAIGAACFVIGWLVGTPRFARWVKRERKSSPFDVQLRELVARNSGGNIELTGDGGTLDCSVGFLNEFPDTATITLTAGSLAGIGTSGQMTIAAVHDEFDLPPRGRRLTAEAEVWKRLRFTLTGTQADAVRAALGIARGEAATRQGTWSLFPAGTLRHSSAIVPWERGQTVLFTVREIPQ